MSLVEQCPLCGTELSQTKFAEIQSVLSKQDRQRAAEQEKHVADAQLALRRQLEQQFQVELTKQEKAAARAAKQGVEEEIKKLVAERDQANKKAKDSETREAQIRAEGVREKETALRLVKQTAQEDVKKIAHERDEANKKLKAAEAREARIRKEALDEATRKNQKELDDQRAALEKDRDDKLLKMQSDYNRERESLQKKAKLMEQQLQKKTANELGDGAEIDLYDALRESFSSDKITRVQKGQAGADILCEVLNRGQSCGRIIIDSKNRQAWQNQFVAKLRQDQVNANAEHAILASTVFPAGKKEMCVESDIIVVHPARVVHIVHILRRAMVAMHVQGLSIKERAGKMSRLYSFITSDSYSLKFSEAGKLTQEILDLDVQEKKAHDNTWKKRGSLATRINHVLREIETEVAAVIEGADSDEPRPAAAADPFTLGIAKTAI